MRKEQLMRYIRYAGMSLRRLTLARLCNLLGIEWRLLTNNPDVSGRSPYVLFVDISNACNLRCPLCQMGQRKAVVRSNRMTKETYARVVGPVANRAIISFLFNWGEPFLNPDLYDIIAFNTTHGIATVVSSNLNLPIDARRLVESGCNFLVVSADGATQEVYEKYRVGGNLETVVANVEKIAAAKKLCKSKFPHIEWQCLVSRHNESTLKAVETLALKSGADSVRFANLNFYSSAAQEQAAREWLPANPSFNSLAPRSIGPNARRRPCFWLWRTALVNPDGGLTPCCLYDIPNWADSLQAGLAAAWNAPLFREARERSIENPEKKNTIICDTCTAPHIYR
jgi:MoaA/NifB/PqqE/SkfB family radical SAM enzyme